MWSKWLHVFPEDSNSKMVSQMDVLFNQPNITEKTVFQKNIFKEFYNAKLCYIFWKDKFRRKLYFWWY